MELVLTSANAVFTNWMEPVLWLLIPWAVFRGAMVVVISAQLVQLNMLAKTPVGFRLGKKLPALRQLPAVKQRL
ncbi:MAG: hypothetical protein A4E53_00827 [Pelotomaculum sp. PtaB.Bin104]|nr:MAG: hypothetical protein A4E53_00827 [Pelotomaculum sp. PtaB.Bin104]